MFCIVKKIKMSDKDKEVGVGVPVQVDNPNQSNPALQNIEG